MKRKYSFNVNITQSIVALSIAVCIILTASFVLYNNKLHLELNANTTKNLSINSNAASQNFDSKLKKVVTDLKNISTIATYSDIDFTNTQKTNQYLNQLMDQNSDYNGIPSYIVGDSLSSLLIGNNLNEFERKMVEVFTSGDNYYFDQSDLSHLKLYVLASLTKEGREIGLLIACYPLENIKELLTVKTFSDEGSAYIFQGSDTSFINNGFKNTPTCLDLFDVVDFKSDFKLTKFQTDIENRKTGKVNYIYKGTGYYAQYYPLARNNWYLLNIVPAKVMNKEAETISKLATMLTTIIIVVMVSLILFIMIIQTYNNSNLKRNQAKLYLEKERYRTVLHHTNSNIWEYNIANDTLIKSDPDLGIYTGQTDIPNFNKTLLQMGIVYHDDIRIFNQFCSDLKSGKKDIKTELRAKDITNKYVWFELTGTTLFDNNQKPISVIGQSSNISELKKVLEELRDNSQRDSLTKLYNRAAIEEKINEVLISTDSTLSHALFMLDINHFRSINETLGHLFGDALLIELSGKITKLVCECDVVGRIGGDEFVIFLYDIPSLEYVFEKANDIESIFKQIYTGEDEHLAVTGTIGISLYPQDGKDFDSLLSKADIALSNAKFIENSSYSLYSDEMTTILDRSQLLSSAYNDSTYQFEERSLIDSNIIANTVDVLFDAKEIDVSINMILGLIGSYYNLDRLYIVEYSDSQQYANMSYEWTMDHSNRIMKKCQNIPAELYENFTYYRSSDNGVFYTNDLESFLIDDNYYEESLDVPVPKAILQCSFADNGACQGYIGASIYDDTRDWTKNEIDSLTLISKIIGGYLLKLRTQEKVIQMERRDQLTASNNVFTFTEIANKIIADNPKQQFAIIYTDFNNFKYINETYGYSQGDRVLKEFAKILGKTTGANEIFGRVNADRFVCLLKCDSRKELLDRLKIVNKKLNNIKKTDTDSFKLSMRFGIYQIDLYQNDRFEKMSSNIDRANIARKSIRNRHKSTCVFFNESMKSSILKQKEIEDVMEDALKNNEFIIYYQPKINLDTNSICGAEALIRWDKSGEGLLPPSAFIPIFEENQFIISIDFFVFEEVCKQLKSLIDADRPVVPISVNFSRVHLTSPTCIPRLKSILNKYQVPPHLLEIELTESALVESDHSLLTLVDGIHRLGIKLSMDDFGSGLSSLNLLRKLPFDIIKLDKGFFQEGKATDRERVVITNVVKMAKELNMSIISEGVETEEQARFLKEINCTMAQGFYFARPMPIEEFEKRYC